MKKFRFRMEPILTLKKQKEEEEIRNFSRVVGRINTMREEMDSLNREITKVGNSLSQKMQKGTGIREYSEYIDISRFLNLKIQSLEKQITDMNPELEMARLRLNKATQEKKILEILKENEKKSHKRKLNKEERKELEELITVRSQMEPGFGGITSIADNNTPTKKREIIDEPQLWDEEEDFLSDEIKPEEKPMTEFERLQKYYDDFTK